MTKYRPASALEGRIASGWSLVISAALTAAIFAADTIFIISPALSVLYILPLLILGNSGARALVAHFAAICIGLAITAFVLGLPLSFGPMALPNLAIGIIAISVTARQLIRSERLQRQLAADERRYRGVFNSMAVAIWECDLRPIETAVSDLQARGVRNIRQHLAHHSDLVGDLRRRVLITDVNDTALRMIGVPDKQAFLRQLDDFLVDSDEAFISCITAISEQQPLFQTQTRVRTAKGEELDVLMAFGLEGSSPLERVVVSLFNMTEQNRLARLIAENKEQLARAQQSAALGQMSASIAHEIEQPLTAIQTSLDAATRWLRRDPIAVGEVNASIQTVLHATQRAMDVIRRIRALIIGNTETESSALEIDALVEEATTLIETDIINSGTRVVHVLNARTVLHADRILLQQVVVNLVRNAVQAMAQTPPDERRILIETMVVEDVVRLKITDCGPGWPPEILAEAFAAFRSTKPGGMGIGLSVCRTIIEAHGGSISLRDAETGGATVEIMLPASQPAANAASLSSDLRMQIRKNVASAR